jgi:Plasmid pRiA4b ORF-3-like protein
MPARTVATGIGCVPVLRPTTAETVHQLDVTLDDIEPRIWRRIEVPSSITLAGLHDVIQGAMGWQGYHLHQFEIGDTVYGVDDGEGPEVVDESRTRLGDVAPEGTVFTYEYDFGDSWAHSIEVSQVTAPAPATTYPRCVAGERACPPEDCGGPWGYTELVDALADPRHEQHEELLEWVGDSFDPAEFDLAEVNARMGRE